ncbi:MAG TPA: toll/interleukin-1 receptor domain-containing protein [Blastocatellia bacterium]|nr:toll/interleukin-1 receptor domain-containing protein [Blastocatellia bacterium]
MPHVFISYSHDDEDKARTVKDYLADAGIKAFIDTSKLKAGDEWRIELQSALDSAFAVIVICTKASMASQEVAFEWAYAMGQGTIIIPLIYEPDTRIHSRLQTLQHLQFSDPRQRPWGTLTKFLSDARDNYEPTSAFLRQAGIFRIVYSRSDLGQEYSISGILNQVKASAELLVISRSGEAWAREFNHMQTALNEKSLHIRLALVNPDIPREQWMIRSDYAHSDTGSTVSKLNQIKIEQSSKGILQVYYLPSSPLFSFVHFEDQDSNKWGILEAGAGLPLNERTILILKSGDHEEGLILKRIHKIYASVLKDLSPVIDLRSLAAG